MYNRKHTRNVCLFNKTVQQHSVQPLQCWKAFTKTAQNNDADCVSYYSQQKNINELILTAEKYQSIHPMEYFKY